MEVVQSPILDSCLVSPYPFLAIKDLMNHQTDFLRRDLLLMKVQNQIHRGTDSVGFDPSDYGPAGQSFPKIDCNLMDYHLS